MRFTRPGARTWNRAGVMTRGSRERHGGAEAFERVDVERCTQGDVDLIGTGTDVLVDARDDVVERTGQHARTNERCERSELPLERLLRPCEPEVHRARDLGWVTTGVS